MSCLLARASCASIAVFRPLNTVGLTDLLRLLLRTFSLLFLRSLVKWKKKYREGTVGWNQLQDNEQPIFTLFLKEALKFLPNPPALTATPTMMTVFGPGT